MTADHDDAIASHNNARQPHHYHHHEFDGTILTRRVSITKIELDAEHLLETKQAALKGLGSELWLFLELAVPTTLLNLGFQISPLLTASYIGRKFSPTHLSGFTLANLTGNLCTFSILLGLFSAADTLGPQAFGLKNYKEIGLIAIRGFCVALAVLIPINIVLVLTIDNILIGLGQDPEAAAHALEWYRIFVLSFPFVILYDTIWKFLSAQHIMRPLIIISVSCCATVLPLGLEILTEKYGYLGSAWAYVNFQATQSLLLLLYVTCFKPYVDGTWPGLSSGSLKEALFVKDSMMMYLDLGVGGILAQSEWIFWEALGLVVGKLGVVALSVHTIPNQVTMALCLAPFSAATALAIRMGVTLPVSVSHAKKIAVACIILVTIFFTLVNAVVYVRADWIIGFFTTDPDVVHLANEIWWKVVVFNIEISLFAILTGVATGLGMQWTLGWVNLFWLWIFGLPAVYYFAVLRDGGLDSAWTWINFPYIGMSLTLISLFAFKADWDRIAEEIQDREGLDRQSVVLQPDENDELQSLLPRVATDDGINEGTRGVEKNPTGYGTNI